MKPHLLAVSTGIFLSCCFQLNRKEKVVILVVVVAVSCHLSQSTCPSFPAQSRERERERERERCIHVGNVCNHHHSVTPLTYTHTNYLVSINTIVQKNFYMYVTGPTCTCMSLVPHVCHWSTCTIPTCMSLVPHVCHWSYMYHTYMYVTGPTCMSLVYMYLYLHVLE